MIYKENHETARRNELTVLHVNQSGKEPLNLENGSSVNIDNFDATDPNMVNAGNKWGEKTP